MAEKIQSAIARERLAVAVGFGWFDCVIDLLTEWVNQSILIGINRKFWQNYKNPPLERGVRGRSSMKARIV